MNYTLNILLDYYENFGEEITGSEIEKYDISMLLLDKECQLSIAPKKSLKECFNDKENYQHMIDELKNMLDIYIKDEDINNEVLYRKFIQYMQKTSMDEFYSKFDNIFIQGTIEQITEFIKKTPEIKNKRLVVLNSYPLSTEGYERAKKDIEIIFNETNIEVSIVIEGNQEATTIEEFKFVLDYIDEIAEEIRKLNLSELEQIMYAYDIVRNRVYTEEEQNELASTSRNLKSIILGNKIVCAGYINLLNTILEKLNIRCSKYHLDAKNRNESGHVRSMIYIDDKKYGVKGIYFFDPTFDSKSDEDIENNFLNTYYTFAKTAGDFAELDKENQLIPRCPYLIPKNYDKLLKNLSDIITPDKILTLRFMMGINNVLALLDRDEVNYLEYSMKSKDEFRQFYDELVKLTNKHISLDIFVELVYNVKKVEYYVHPEIFKFNSNSIKKAIISFLKFSPVVLSREELLLGSIFGKSKQELLQEKYDETLEQINKKEQKIAQVKLTRTLKTILENKKSNC